MKHFFILFFASLCFCQNSSAQNCTSPATNYDLTVVSLTVFPPQSSSMNYMQGYVCPGATLIDSAMCCTRMVNIDSGATMFVGPMSYGMAYVKSGGTFNGQGASNNWQVYAEAGASIINHTGLNNACPQVVFTGGTCSMGFNSTVYQKPTVALNGSFLNFAFSTSVSAQVELLDVTGKVVISESINNSSVHSMNVAGLAEGIYMYRVVSGGSLIASDRIVLSK